MIRWKRSSDGFCESHCGRWRITPLYCGCVNPQAYDLYEGSRKAGGWYTNQREAKDDAERIATRQLPDDRNKP